MLATQVGRVGHGNMPLKELAKFRPGPSTQASRNMVYRR
jgi:hypothetical protein